MIKRRHTQGLQVEYLRNKNKYRTKTTLLKHPLQSPVATHHYSKDSINSVRSEILHLLLVLDDELRVQTRYPFANGLAVHGTATTNLQHIYIHFEFHEAMPIKWLSGLRDEIEGSIRSRFGNLRNGSG